MSATLMQPDYMGEFACKCAACRRSCCIGDWTIQLTRDEFLYDTDPARGPELHEIAERGLRRDPQSTSDDDYGCCILGPNGYCAVLTDDSLCSWQKITGSCVGSTCNDFPRTYLSYCGETYLFPTGACERVLELLLAKEDPLELVAQETASPRTLFNTVIDGSHFANRPLLAYYPQLRHAGITILQDRAHSLDERMTVLAQMMSLVDYLEKNKQADTVPDALERFLQPDNLENTAQRYAKQDIGPQALLVATAQMLTRLADVPGMRAFAIRVLQGIGVQLAGSPEDGSEEGAPLTMTALDMDVYRARKAKLSSYGHEKEYFLENIMVSEYLRDVVPFTYGDTWTSFRAFNSVYAFHKAFLYGVFDSEPSDEELIDTYVLLHRKIIHNHDLMNEVLDQGSRLGLTDLSAMVGLANG